MPNNIKDSLFSSQASSFNRLRDVVERPDSKEQSPDQQPLASSRKRSTEDPTLLITNDTQIRFLCLLNECFPEGLRSTQIAEAVHIHRSTASNNANDLLEMGLIEKSVVPGTENHVNPTLLFRISPKFKDKVQSFLDLRLKADPRLRIAYTSDGNNSDDFAPSDGNELGSEVAESFEQQVEHGFKVLAQQILSMQREIDELKRRLNETPQEKPNLLQTLESFGFSYDGGAE